MNNENEVRTVILYEGKYGTAERYAHMLAGMRDAEVVRAGDAKLTALRLYRTIILIGAVYDGAIQGLDTLKKYYGKLRQQDAQNESTQQYDRVHRYAVLAVGAAPEEEAVKTFAAELPGELAEIPLFYARGVWNTGALDARDALRVELARRALQSEKAETREGVPGWLSALLEEDKACDFTDEAYLDPLADVIDGRF